MNTPPINAKPYPVFKMALLGGGNMAQAMIAGLLRQGFDSKNITVWEHDQAKHSALKQGFGINVESIPNEKLAEHPLWVLAVKPQDIESLGTTLAPLIKEPMPLILSIAAGITIATLKKNLKSHISPLRLVRVMPNTPAAVGAGISGAFANADCQPIDKQMADVVLKAMGQVLWLDKEEDLDCVTAISGSGSAYFFYFAECLEQAAIKMGLSPTAARQLALQTFAGAGMLASSTTDSLSTLREKVTSKGGTTEAALKVFARALPELTENATQAAKVRAQEIGQF